MPIPFTCPHCELETNVGDQFAGQSGPCSKCGNTVTVPGSREATPFAAPSAPTKSSTSVGLIVLIVVLVVFVLGTLLLFAGMLIFWRMSGLRAAPKILPQVVFSEGDDSTECSNNLKKIALAMHNYHDAFMCLPPAVITDEQGTPRYSWRVAILPFIEQQALYDQWNHNEPWDSPNNMRIGQTSIPAYRCPSDEGGDPLETNYMMITGEEAVGKLPNEGPRLTKSEMAPSTRSW